VIGAAAAQADVICGLDALTDKLGIERVKMENILQRSEIKR
jgi:hypothetical protein